MADESVKVGPDSKRILEHITQCVITTDLNGVVTYWNTASERIFGYLREEMLNRSLIKIYPTVAEEQFKNDLNTLKNGKEVKGQWKSITRDGSIIWIDVHAKPLTGDAGNPTAIIALAYDIQDLKNIEKELEENKARAQAILETTVDGIITIDEDGLILSFNQAASRIFGYNEQEVIGKNVKILVPESFGNEQVNSVNNDIRRYIGDNNQRDTGYRRELNGKRKDGSIFPMELSMSEIQWNSSRIYTGVVNDISERRRLEREILRISEEERRNLGQDLHDGLGQMLTGISLISQNLARKLKGDGLPGADRVQEISNLIKEADEYAKALAHGLVHIDFEDEGLQTALRQLSYQAEKLFNIRCSFEFDANISIDNNIQAMNLYRIAQEAISNAVKHGKADNISIRLSVKNGSIKLSVEDNGIGFAQSAEREKKKGMGIQIMKYRANLMSGKLDIFKTDDNKTNVVCSIPQMNT